MPGPASDRPPSIEELDGLDPRACQAALAPLFEGAPRFLARLCADRPFGDAAGLFVRARALARAIPEAERLELIDAHPRLGADAGSMSVLSRLEQGGHDGAPAAAAPDEAAARTVRELQRLNAAYEARFGFRYCVFVAGRPREALLAAFEAALSADREAELARALDAVIDIAADRYRRLTSSAD